MPIFTNFSAIWGSLIFLGLIAVYIYRRRSRNIVVSSLMFFSKSRTTAEGGQKLHKLQTPLIFYIELLIFLLFILAIADPMDIHKGQLIPLTIVLDDSLSMTAGDKNSPQNKSLRFLKDNIFNKSIYSFTLIKAGDKPRIIGRRGMNPAEAENTLRSWNCDSVTSNLMLAVSQAIEMGTADTMILVLTDHLNDKNTSDSIKWVAFGVPRDNIAITAANRSANGRMDRCFFEFTNYSNQSKTLNAEIIDINSGDLLESVNDTIGPRSTRRLIVKVREQNDTVKAIIKDDEITYDNEVVLLPIKREKLKVGLSFENKALSDAVKKAVESTDLAVLTNSSPQVIISDKKRKIENANLLSEVIIHNASQSFVVANNIAADKEFSVTSDLPIDNAIWVADNNYKQPGSTLLISGNVPLLSIDEDSEQWGIFYLNYTFNKSNMQRTSFWPILFYNILEWSFLRQPGPTAFNFKSGSRIDVVSEKNTTKIYLKNQLPNAKPVEGLVINRKISFIAGSPGLYELQDGDKKYTLAVNLCSYEESDLTKAESSKTFPEIISDENMSHFESVKWWFILTAFVLLLLHQWLISRRRAGYAF